MERIQWRSVSSLGILFSTLLSLFLKTARLLPSILKERATKTHNRKGRSFPQDRFQRGASHDNPRSYLKQPMIKDRREKEMEEGSIDFVLVDADNGNYMEYHERLLRLVRVGGVIAYDNTLWFGTVPDSAKKFHPLMKNEQMRNVRGQARKINSALALDSHIEISHLPIGDGLTLSRRLH